MRMSFFKRVIIQEFRGINTLVPAHMIDDREAQEMRDCRIDLGRLEARQFRNKHGPPAGVTTWKEPIRFFSKLHDGATVKDIVISDGNIYRDYTSLESGFDQKDNWSGFIYNGSLYIASKNAMRAVGATTLYNWGIAKPTDTIEGAAGAAGEPSGTYYYKVTFYNTDGIESDSSGASDAVTVADQKVSLTTVPLSSDSQVTGRYVYRIGGLVSTYRRIGTIADNTTTTLSDNISDAAASSLTELSVSSHDEPDSMPIVALHNGRAYYAGNTTYPNRLYYSDSLYPEYSGNYRVIGGYEKLVSLVTWEGELFMWKQGEIYSLQGSTPGTGFIRQLQVKRGTVSANSVAVGKFPTYIYWDGIYTHDGYTDAPVGRKLYDLFTNDLNTDALKNSVAVATRQFYIASVPEKGEDNPTLTIVYNYETRDCTILEFGATALYADEGGIVYVGTADGKIYTLGGKYNSEDETINMDWLSKKFLMGPIPGRSGSIKNATIISDTKGEDVEVIAHVDGVRNHCGVINSNGIGVDNISLSDRDGEFLELELKYSGEKRPIIYPPLVINPDGEGAQ